MREKFYEVQRLTVICSKMNDFYSNTNKSILENWQFDNLNSYTQMYRGWRKEMIRILSIIDQ